MDVNRKWEDLGNLFIQYCLLLIKLELETCFPKFTTLMVAIPDILVVGHIEELYVHILSFFWY